MAEKKEKVKFGKGMANWFRAIKSEFKKIIWPTSGKIAKDTGIVIVTVVIVAAFLSLVNYLFDLGIGKLLG